MEGEQMITTGLRAEDLPPGTYTLEVTDAEGCTVTETATLTAPPAIEVNGFVTNPSCVGERNGEITVVASGGTGSFAYDWSNQVASPNVSFLAAGRYTVTVTDNNNCTAVETYDLDDPAAIQVSIETTPATDGCNGSARASVTGGVGPYTFRWNSNAASMDSNLVGLCPGDYVLEVTDARGCTTGPDMILAEVFDRRFPCMDMRSVITPDGNGLNDEFVINCIEELDNNRLMIFNRWGQLVFEAENYQNDWRGQAADGGRLPDGAYYFILEYNDNEGNFIQTKGSITLLREE
jgi:gliding motility-associated-like protein